MLTANRSAQAAEPSVYWKYTGIKWDAKNKKFTVKGQIINNSNKTIIRLDDRTLTVTYKLDDGTIYGSKDNQKLVFPYTTSKAMNIAPGSFENWDIGPISYQNLTDNGRYKFIITGAVFPFGYKLGDAPAKGGSGKGGGVTININQ